jgi:hypothetical protein
MGRLVAAMKRKFSEFVVVFFQFNENDQKPLRELLFLNSVQNLATSISFDADHIIVGDTFKNVSVLKVCDAEENKQEKLAD